MMRYVSLVSGLLLLVIWIIAGLIVPLGAGWIHLALAAAVMLLIRAVVTMSDAPKQP